MNIIEVDLYPNDTTEKRDKELARLRSEGAIIMEITSADRGVAGMRYYIHYAEQGHCPYCLSGGSTYEALDDMAIHLIDRHGWDYDTATLWLRNLEEELAIEKEA